MATPFDISVLQQFNSVFPFLLILVLVYAILSQVEWFKEKKFGDKRLYYLVYQNLNKVLLVAFGSKKDQQKIIDHIIENKDRYKKVIESV